jgi:hypothetical protein
MTLYSFVSPTAGFLVVAVSDDSVSIKKQLIWVQHLKESKLDSKRDWYEYCVIVTYTQALSGT